MKKVIFPFLSILIVISVVLSGCGLGDLAITYGYQRFSTITIVVTVVILVIIVQGIQSLGNLLERKMRRV